jgi:formylglycine-generating enzyme required for sulfatase activity
MNDIPPDDSDFTLPMLAWRSVSAGEVVVELGEWLNHLVYRVTEKRLYRVAAFMIAQYPVTNAQFEIFVIAPEGYANASWWDFSPEARAWRTRNPQPAPVAAEGATLPRTNVCWYEAVAFCRWLSFKTGLEITLPTEAEWQRAAQGDDTRRFPWGDSFDSAKCNAWEDRASGLTAVDRFPHGASPFGAVDMVGNAWEWCLNTYDDPAGADLTAGGRRVVRGGSWNSDQARANVLCRRWYYPVGHLARRGFRLARRPGGIWRGVLCLG